MFISYLNYYYYYLVIIIFNYNYNRHHVIYARRRESRDCHDDERDKLFEM